MVIFQLYLVGGWTDPFEKYSSKWDHFPNDRGENSKKYLSCHQLVYQYQWEIPWDNICFLRKKCFPMFFTHHRQLPTTFPTCWPWLYLDYCSVWRWRPRPWWSVNARRHAEGNGYPSPCRTSVAVYAVSWCRHNRRSYTHLNLRRDWMGESSRSSHRFLVGKKVRVLSSWKKWNNKEQKTSCDSEIIFPQKKITVSVSVSFLKPLANVNCHLKFKKQLSLFLQLPS